MDLKTIGIVGITAEGAALCYRTIVSESAVRIPSSAHPPIALYNPSLHLINKCVSARDWKGMGELVRHAMNKLNILGVDLIIMPSNAPHYAANYFVPECPVPYLSIVDLSAEACVAAGYKHVGILGVGVTMSDGLYVQPLKSRGIEPIIPSTEEQALINKIIFEQIIPARVTRRTAPRIAGVISQLQARGAEAVILGCTEIPIVINERNCPLPFIDTTRLLAKKALEFAMDEVAVAKRRPLRARS